MNADGLLGLGYLLGVLSGLICVLAGVEQLHRHRRRVALLLLYGGSGLFLAGCALFLWGNL